MLHFVVEEKAVIRYRHEQFPPSPLNTKRGKETTETSQKAKQDNRKDKNRLVGYCKTLIFRNYMYMYLILAILAVKAKSAKI